MTDTNGTMRLIINDRVTTENTENTETTEDFLQRNNNMFRAIK